MLESLLQQELAEVNATLDKLLVLRSKLVAAGFVKSLVEADRLIAVCNQRKQLLSGVYHTVVDGI